MRAERYAAAFRRLQEQGVVGGRLEQVSGLIAPCFRMLRAGVAAILQ
jgi:hypothetical protein